MNCVYVHSGSAWPQRHHPREEERRTRHSSAMRNPDAGGIGGIGKNDV